MPLRRLHLAALAAASTLAAAPVAHAAPSSWAAPQIKAVTSAGVLGTSPATFRPQDSLVEGDLATAIAATDKLRTPAPVTTPVAPVTIYSTIASGATVAGALTWQVAAPGQRVDHVVFLVDNVVVDQQTRAPYTFKSTPGAFASTALGNGVHQLGLQVVLAGGATYGSAWSVVVANDPRVPVPPVPAGVGMPVPITSAPPPAPAPPARPLYRAATPARSVTVKELDAALVDYLGLGAAAKKIQATLAAAGLHPRPATGTEAVARLLGLRYNHPAGHDDLELLPNDPATRAEAAYSFAQVLHLDDWATRYAQQAADAFALPTFTPWQQRILATAISYVGYPYVWGGESPTTETQFGSTARGGFDCSGFVWRVYKLTSYADEGTLASMLRGRTTYEMSGEVTRAKRVAAAKLIPGDVMFFGNGPTSSPSVVGHTGIYLGNGWFVHSSDQGTTLRPFDGWYAKSFAWARRPLREAGLAGST